MISSYRVRKLESWLYVMESLSDYFSKFIA